MSTADLQISGTTARASAPVSNHLLEVSDLKMHFPVPGKRLLNGKSVLKAVDGVSFWIDPGETLGLVGESGCGKSTLARAIVQLYNPTSGGVIFRGHELTTARGMRLWQARRQIQMIFQDPYASLNPRMTVYQILAEPLQNYGETRDLDARLEELLNTVGLDASALYLYPHEFSGGQRQRIGIARALALNPALVIADEPASALDVSIQAQIIKLLRDLQIKRQLSYLFISHDLSAVSLISHRVAVMYLGEIVELGPMPVIFSHPWHPYTEALRSAVLSPDPKIERQKARIVLQGDIPSPLGRPTGCTFHSRCPYVFARCRDEKPPLREYAPGRWVSCHLMEDQTTSSRPSSESAAHFC